jgi:hypothetical protein
MASTEEKLAKAEDMFAAARTTRERENVEHWQNQVSRTGNTGGRAQGHLDAAKALLERSELSARELFRSEIERE